MDWNHVERMWQHAKDKVQEKWGKLTEDDVDLIGGRRDRLEGKIQQRYGFATDHVRKEVDDWVSLAGADKSTTPKPNAQIPVGGDDHEMTRGHSFA